MALSACGTERGAGAQCDPFVSAVEFNLKAAPSLAGSYLRIEGMRRNESTLVPAEATYPCLSRLEPACVPFDSTGSLARHFEDLCPSTDNPVSPWRFDFAVFNSPTCDAQSRVTGNDFACYDASNLAGLEYPNSSWVMLVPGDNDPNHIICITTGAGL